MDASNVLVVRVPSPIEDLDACVEHIKRGLCDGILILGADVSYRVERFPPLGAVEVVDEPVPDSGTGQADPELPPILPADGVSRPEPKPPGPPPPPPPAEKPKPAERIDLQYPVASKAAPKPAPDAGPTFVGQGAIEKRKIHERLTRYWTYAEPGAMQRLADQIGWPVANVYGAQRAEKFDMDHWRQLARGMDALGFEVDADD